MTTVESWVTDPMSATWLVTFRDGKVFSFTAEEIARLRLAPDLNITVAFQLLRGRQIRREIP